jgi:hypothetical protein
MIDGRSLGGRLPLTDTFLGRESRFSDAPPSWASGRRRRDCVSARLRAPARRLQRPSQGSLNPGVKQSNIKRTIRVPNWTDTVRPPTSYTNKLKVQDIADYGFAYKTLGHLEEDHLIPLAIGGSPRSPKNLWPENYAGKFGARVKDKLERFDRVCDGTVRLSKARRAFRNWKAAFKRYGV